ncbi:glycosyltransferase family 2 protein [Terrarubrum flagellatum]|uniref:glycosyltransferase family 2 protein n=1 Tax=Terrirubrum flagellatum TaxID=2895980 RepID=UPI0031452AEC
MAASRNQPSVAVIIPFYNGAAFIERALRSVFDQTRTADEIIVVDDGSRPDERAALDAILERYPATLISKANGGQGSARNAGVVASQSDFLCFLDQDDFYLENHIETLVAAIPHGDRRFGYVYGDLYEADADGNVLRTAIIEQHSVHPKRAIAELLRFDMFILPSASLISRAAFEAVGGFDSDLRGYEDDDLFLRMFRKGYTGVFIDKPVTVWCIHTGSTSFGVHMMRSRYRYFTKLLQWFPDNPEMGRYYFRDCIMPRFGPAFVNDAVKSARQHGQEAREILKRYDGLVWSNPTVRRSRKLFVRLTAWLLLNFSPSLARNLTGFAQWPFARRIARRVF